MSESLECYRCGTALNDLSLPLSRQDECPNCRVYLHCCRLCQYYAPSVPKQCREDDAEEVRDKQRANFCDYFKPAAGRFDTGLAAGDQRAGSEAAALFGDDPVEPPPDNPDNDLSEAEKLFK